MQTCRYGVRFLSHLRNVPLPQGCNGRGNKNKNAFLSTWWERQKRQQQYCSAGKPKYEPAEEQEEHNGEERKSPKRFADEGYKSAQAGVGQKDPKPEEKPSRQDPKQEQQQDQNTNHKKQQQAKKSTSLPSIKNPFEAASEKTKESYLMMVEIFNERNVHRRNHVEFIYAALKHMAAYGVEHDLEVYKALINVMPKGKFIPTNVFQAEFMHYPKQQQCIIDLLEQMEDLGVMPDAEMEQMLLNVFGRKGHPLRKYWRMMYWMPKFRNLSPWPLPNPVPDVAKEIARLAVERMCSVDVRSVVTEFQTKDVKEAIDDTWIVSGMSIEQSELLREHPKDKALYIEGPFLIWLRNRSINYFTLRADPDREMLQEFKDAQYRDEDDVAHLKVSPFAPPPPRKYEVGKVRSVHQQDDGTILAICATGSSSKDSLLSWLRLLVANGNPALGEIPVLFRFTSDLPEKAEQIEGGPDGSSNIVPQHRTTIEENR